MDRVFEQEQQHLDRTYDQLLAIRDELTAKIEARRAEGTQDISDMLDEITLDFASEDNAIETSVEIETMNSVIQSYNLLTEANAERLRRALLLLDQPYFAKITLRFKPDEDPRDIYLGNANMADDNYHHFIIDWRSPVAEVYYNQDMGPTTYEAHGRTIHTDLLLRRQFDIERNVLRSYFDTNIAIEDPLLLSSLSRHRTEKLQAITATIQKEQNQVIRHADVPALVVNGIAGSGKTSVLLQRIAYLFYQQRESLDPSQVHLLTPNRVFGSYIDRVLPDMGERNPHIFTWHDFLENQGVLNRGLGGSTSLDTLRRLEKGVAGLEFLPDDFAGITIEGETLIKPEQVRSAYAKCRKAPMGAPLTTQMAEDLEKRLEGKLTRMAASEGIQTEMSRLPHDQQLEIFGEPFMPDGDDQLRAYGTTYVNHRYGRAYREIEDARWLRFDRIGMRILGTDNISSIEWLFLKTLLTAAGDAQARYVLVDEVQDYTAAQLTVLARYFRRAHFLLLGDQNQAINPGTASFGEVKDVFVQERGTAEEVRLTTSYRSTPEITRLFMSLADDGDTVEASSVHREGRVPDIRTFVDEDAYAEALRFAVDHACEQGELCAVVAQDGRSVKQAARILGDRVQVIRKNATLPESGAVLLDLPLAKGLEFDHVIIPDATSKAYAENPLSRRRLYTAISRATQRVTILAQGKLTPLLEESR